MGKKQSYTSSMDIVEAGFIACWHNIRDLVRSARLLHEHGEYAPTLSLSILAMEEIGKLVALDGMLLAIQGDEKSKLLKEISRSHKDKLHSLVYLPFFIDALCRRDPRFEKEERYRLAVTYGAINLKEAGNKVLILLGNDSDFSNLDIEKQKGFYTSIEQQHVVAPRDAVSQDLSEAVFKFVELADGNLNFALKDGNLDRYISFFREIRIKISVEDHAEIKGMAQNLAMRIFGLENDN